MRGHLAIACLVLGCGGDNNHAADAAKQVDAQPIDATPIDAPETTMFDGVVLTAGSAQAPIGDAVVCTENLPDQDCEGTGSDGSFTVTATGVPGNGVGFALDATATGFVTTEVLGYSQLLPSGAGFITTSPGSIVMLDEATGSALFDAAGFHDRITQSAFIRAVVIDASVNRPLAGATVSLVGGSAANGPVYFGQGSDGTFTPDPALTATGSDGEVLFGNLLGGEFALDVTVAGKTCEGSGLAWPGSNGATASGVTERDAITDDVQVYCQ